MLDVDEAGEQAVRSADTDAGKVLKLGFAVAAERFPVKLGYEFSLGSGWRFFVRLIADRCAVLLIPAGEDVRLHVFQSVSDPKPVMIRANAGQGVALDLVDSVAEDNLTGRLRLDVGWQLAVGDVKQAVGFFDFADDFFGEAGFVSGG